MEIEFERNGERYTFLKWAKQAFSGIQVSLEDPGFVADAVFDRLVYGFHPYGMPGNGTPETIARITRDDLFAFHKRYFVPNNAILAIVGDLTAEEAFATAKKIFGGWESRDPKPEPFIDAPEPTRRVIVIDKPDAVQTEIRMGHIGIPRRHPDYMALDLATRVLGGEGRVGVSIDGRPIKTVRVSEDRLYDLAELPGEARDHTLDLSFTPGTEAYAFTFG